MTGARAPHDGSEQPSRRAVTRAGVGPARVHPAAAESGGARSTRLPLTDTAITYMRHDQRFPVVYRTLAGSCGGLPHRGVAGGSIAGSPQADWWPGLAFSA
jgi:hypothetical protein